MTVTLDQHNMKDYQETAKGFKWEIPEYYNFALDHFDKWTKDKTKIALITVSEDGSSSTKLTFWELSILANKFANVLNSLGMKKGDRVLLMLPRSIEWYVAILGIMKAGIVAMPTPNLVTGHDIEYRINSAEAVMAITNKEGAEKVDVVRTKLPSLKCSMIVGATKAGWKSFNKSMAKASRVFNPDDFVGKTKSSDPMLIFFTSGTTGNPKMVRHNQSYAIAHIVTARYIQDLRPTDIIWVHADTGWAKTAYGKILASGSWAPRFCSGEWAVNSTPSICRRSSNGTA